MALLTKPNMQQVWASGGDIVEPSDLKKQQGWTVEVPPHQFENWIQNRQDEYLAHINQRGIPAWDGLTNYEASGLSYVQGSDGKVYKSVAASGPSSVVSNPTTDGTDTYWTIAFADVGAFLTQAAGDVRYTQRSNNLSDLTNVAAARTNLALGTAATATLTTSATDGTAGRVIKVGDFGLGAMNVPISNTDLNALNKTGFYVGEALINSPAAASWYYVIHQESSPGYSSQIATDLLDPARERIYARKQYTGSWSAWREIALTDSPAFTGTPTAPTPPIGTRSTAIATMQNFANEFGSSLATSGYQKLPSGLIIQWGTRATSGSSTITFPLAFLGACYSVTASPGDGNGVPVITDLTNTGFTMSSTPINNRWIAVGK